MKKASKQQRQGRVSDRSFEAKKRSFDALAKMRQEGLSLKLTARAVNL